MSLTCKIFLGPLNRLLFQRDSSVKPSKFNLRRKFTLEFVYLDEKIPQFATLRIFDVMRRGQVVFDRLPVPATHFSLICVHKQKKFGACCFSDYCTKAR